MKKLILIMIIGLNIFSANAEMISRTNSVDEETGETIITETYENEIDGKIERKIVGFNYPIVSYITDYYDEKNSEKISYSTIYDANVETNLYKIKETYYQEDSEKKKEIIEEKVIDNETRYVITTEFKSWNKEHIDNTVITSTIEGNNLNQIFYYTEESNLICKYIDFLEGVGPTYVREDLRDHPQLVQNVEYFFSYPNYSFFENCPYKMIVNYIDNPACEIKQQINTYNEDGTCIIECITN